MFYPEHLRSLYGIAYTTYLDSKALSGSKEGYTLDQTLEVLKFYAYVVGGIVLIWQVCELPIAAQPLWREPPPSAKRATSPSALRMPLSIWASDSESIRMGGIYGLYHVARESREYADTVLENYMRSC